METGCISCTKRSTCDFVTTDEEDNYMPDPEAIAGECPYYEMDRLPLATTMARQASVERVAQLVKSMYPDHLMVQVYLRFQQVDVPVYKYDCDRCDRQERCDEDPTVCEDSIGVEAGETEPSEYTKFVINIQTKDKLTDQEGVVRMQEIQTVLQALNDDEIQVENCVFELSFVHVVESPALPVNPDVPEGF